MPSVISVARFLFLLTLLAACRETNQTSGECSADADCTGGTYCHKSACVECAEETHCDRHARCDMGPNACTAFGAPSSDLALNAHGNWTGTPGSETYAFEDFCRQDSDCTAGRLCNPFTAGCVIAADFDTPCDAANPCTLPNTACAPGIARCLPAGLCVSDYHCTEGLCAADGDCAAGEVCNALTAACVTAALFTTPCAGGCALLGPAGELLACDKSHNLCLPAPRLACGCGPVCREKKAECSPVAVLDACCPASPRPQTAFCAVGEFCSPHGECVQCLCDGDCPLSGRCHPVSGKCVADNFCSTAEECDSLLESCDRADQVCKPRCDDDGDCETDEYCKTVPYVQPSQQDFVCRPRAELPCLPDSFEPNQTADEALANARALPLPTPGNDVDVPNLSLCDFDGEDWFTLALAAGDHLDIRGTSLTTMIGDMSVYLADGLSLLDTGVFSSGGSEMLSFTAQRAGLYFVRISLGSAATGLYNLNLTLTTGALCGDTFEDTNGANDGPEDATPLNDPAPAGCTLTGSLGGTHTVTCAGAQSRICPFEVDYYSISAHAGATVTVQLSGLGANLDLTLYGPYLAGEPADTSRVAASSTGAGVSDELAQGTSRAAASYLVRVYPLPGSSTSAYNLELSVVSGPTCVEDSYDGVAAATGGAPPLPTLVSDRDGLNDDFSALSFVGLVPGGTVTVKTSGAGGLTLCRADRDWFRLGVDDGGGSLADLPAGVRVAARLTEITKASGDRLTLAAGASESALGYGSADPQAPASQLLIPLTDGGPYYVLVLGSTTNAQQVTYTLELEYLEPPLCSFDGFGDVDAADRNETPATAKLLSSVAGWPDAVNESHEQGGLSACVSDDDWYRLVAPQNTSTLITVLYDPSEAELGLALYDSSVLGAQLSPGEPPALGLRAWSAVDGRAFQRSRAVVGGDVYMMVYNRSGWPLLGYSLRAQLLPASCFVDAYEQNDTWEAATPLVFAPSGFDPQLQVARLELATACWALETSIERDWYRAPLSAGDHLAATIYYDPDQGDLDLYMYEPGPEGLNVAVASAHDNTARSGVLAVDYEVPSARPSGDYLLEVRPSGTFANFYLLDAEARRVCIADTLEPSSWAQPAALAWPPSLASLTLCREEDWYRVVPQVTGPVEACVRFDHAAGNIDLIGYADNQTTILGGSSSPVTNYESAVFAATAGQTYYLRVLMPALGNTSYTLEMGADADIVCP